MTEIPVSALRPPAPVRPGPETSWAVESDSILLVRRDTGRTARLDYPEAALWDFMQRAVPFHRVVAMIAALTGLDTAAASAWIARTFARWTGEGWCDAGDGHG